jgi:photosystem II stability/assembly factor-like uncharacterized protein
MDRKLARLLLPLTLLFSAFASAGTNTWTPLGPDGGYVFQVAFHPTDPAVLYAVTPGGLYRTTDTGNSWQLLKGDFGTSVFGIAVSSGVPDRVLLAGNSTVHVSDDRGAHFETRNIATAANGINVRMSRDGKTVYYSAGTKVFRSTDSGNTWQAGQAIPGSDPMQLISALDIDPADSKVVYATVFALGIFRSADGGDTWQSLATSPAAISRVLGFTVDPTNGQRLLATTETGVYVSLDGGASWGTTPLLAGYITDIDVDPTNPSILYALGSGGELKKSVDGGQQWTPSVTAGSSYALGKLVIAPSRSASLAFLGSDGVMISEDGGAHWSKRNAGLQAGIVQSLVAGTGRTYAAVRPSGVYAIASGTSVAAPLNNATLVTLDSQEPFSFRLAVLPGQPDTLFATINSATLARSTDGGANWAKLPLPAQYPDYIVSSPQEPQTLYVNTQGGLYRSADGGTQWVSRSAGLPVGESLVVLTPTARAGTVYAVYLKQPGNTSRIFRTTDAGVTWTQVGAGWNDYIYALAVHPQNEQTLYASVGSNVQMSTDGGTTWSVLKDATGTALCCSMFQIAFDPANPKIMYVVAAYTILRSADGGVNWQFLEGLTYGVQQNVLAFDSQPSTLLVGTYGQGVRQITLAPDIEVSLSNPASVAANVAASWGATVRNIGPYDATDVRVTVQFPAGTTGIAAGGNGATCSVATTTVTCTYDVLRTKTPTSTLTLNATPAANGSFSVSASASADQPDSVTANNNATREMTVPTSPPVAAPSGGGGGGGGAISLEVLAMLGALTLLRVRRPKHAGPNSPDLRHGHAGAASRGSREQRHAHWPTSAR